MPRLNTIRVIRTTRANLNAQATAGNLLPGEPYLITDENRFAVATSASAYQAMALQSEAGGGGGGGPLAISVPATPSAGFLTPYGAVLNGRDVLGYRDDGGLLVPLQASHHKVRRVAATPVPGSTSVSLYGLSLSGTGTATASGLSSLRNTGFVRALAFFASTSTTAVAGVRSGAAVNVLGGAGLPYAGGFHFSLRWGVLSGGGSGQAVSTLRSFHGYSSTSTAPTDAEPSASVNDMIGVGCDAADANYQIMHRNFNNTVTKINTGIPKVTGDHAYELGMYCTGVAASGVPPVNYVFTRLTDGVSFSGTINSNLPAYDTGLFVRSHVSVGGTSTSLIYYFNGLEIESLY